MEGNTQMVKPCGANVLRDFMDPTVSMVSLQQDHFIMIWSCLLSFRGQPIVLMQTNGKVIPLEIGEHLK
jgi:hypothetical protein